MTDQIPEANAGKLEAGLYDRAVVFATRDKPSTSYLQRRLQIGYNQAAGLIERMEAEGLISKPNSAGKREILIAYRPAPTPETLGPSAAFWANAETKEGEAELVNAAWAMIEHFERVDGDERHKAVIAQMVRALTPPPALQPSSAADAKPVAWPTEEAVARKLATIKGHRDLEREIVCDDQVARPVWQIYLPDAQEVMSLYTQPNPSQQAGAEGALRAQVGLWLADYDDGRRDMQLDDDHAERFRAILTALKPVEG